MAKSSEPRRLASVKPGEKPEEKKPKKQPKVPATDRCFGCDAGTGHHPGKNVAGCNCASCGSGTGQG